MTVYPDQPDSDLSNNSLTMCFPVRNSFDPNTKEVYPSYRVDGNTWVYYNIHFQNTGNDTAYHVVIKDTLSSKLNVSSFQVLNSSHRVITELESNVVSFTFPRINLVDSLTNEKLSHGWVQFKIKTDPSVDEFTEIENTASIYFDTNDPILTNVAYINQLTTNTTLVGQNMGQINVYPNPAKNTITVNTKNIDSYQLTVLNTFGQTLIKTSFKDKTYTLPIDGLASGIYYIRVQNSKGSWFEKVVKE